MHAGDIGTAEILEQLRAIAPVTAVRGNNDKGAWARGIAEHEVVEIGGKSIYVLHDLKELDRRSRGVRIFRRRHRALAQAADHHTR